MGRYTDGAEWKAYLQLKKERPQEFQENPYFPIVLEAEIVENYVQKSGERIGVVYASPYHLLVVDLIQNNDGRLYTYERLLPAVERGAVVALPRYKGKYVLLKQYRHSLHDYQYAFPRGFGEPGISSEENVKKELREEAGAVVKACSHLGVVVADSGVSGNPVDVYECELSYLEEQKGHEGIETLCFLSREEMEEWIRNGQIQDGFTLAAWALYLSGKTERGYYQK